MKVIILLGMGANPVIYPKNSYKHLQDVTFIDCPKYGNEISLTQVGQKSSGTVTNRIRAYFVTR